MEQVKENCLIVIVPYHIFIMLSQIINVFISMYIINILSMLTHRGQRASGGFALTAKRIMYGSSIKTTKLNMLTTCLSSAETPHEQLFEAHKENNKRQAWVHALGGGMDGRAKAVLDLPPRLAVAAPHTKRLNHTRFVYIIILLYSIHINIIIYSDKENNGYSEREYSIGAGTKIKFTLLNKFDDNIYIIRFYIIVLCTVVMHERYTSLHPLFVTVSKEFSPYYLASGHVCFTTLLLQQNAVSTNSMDGQKDELLNKSSGASESEREGEKKRSFTNSSVAFFIITIEFEHMFICSDSNRKKYIYQCICELITLRTPICELIFTFSFGSDRCSSVLHLSVCTIQKPERGTS
ncbi:hypothetical protein ACJX0J_026056, partial [Zea mays]